MKLPSTLDLEQAIMDMWGTADDIKSVYDYIGNKGEMDLDEIMNALLGLYTLHRIKSNNAFNIFDNFIGEVNEYEQRVSENATKAVETTQGSH